MTVNYAEDAMDSTSVEISDEKLGTIAALANKQLMLQARIAQLEGDLEDAKEDFRQVSEMELPNAMAEVGVDLSEEFPKPLTDEFVRAADAVITMGCGDACPIYPGKRYEDWELEDPDGKDLETVRAIRDEIDGRVRRLLAELVPDAA